MVQTARSQVPSTVEYVPSAGQYRDAETKRFVPRSRILLELDREKQATQARLSGLTRRLSNGSLSVSEWQIEMGQTLKNSHLRLASLSAGGRSQLTPRHLGVVGGRLRGESNRIANFSREMKAGNVSVAQAIARSKLYAQSALQTFHAGEKISRELEGKTLGMRSLDPGADHCRQCPGYVTGGFVPIDQIVPIGTDCDCRGNCRCNIVYRNGPQRALI